MTIDINELRNDAKTAHFGHTPLEVPGSEMLELIDQLEAVEAECLEEARLNGMGSERELALMAKLEVAEKERDNANAAAIGVALQAEALQAEIDNIKEVQFDLKVSAVAEGWRGKCERLEKERDDIAQQLVQSEISKREISEAHNAVTRRLSVLADENTALRARIAEMEQQETLYLFRRKGLDDFCTCSKERYEAFSANPRLFEVKTLYALPGAKGE